jgi:hypothetical protein
LKPRGRDFATLDGWLLVKVIKIVQSRTHDPMNEIKEWACAWPVQGGSSFSFRLLIETDVLPPLVLFDKHHSAFKLSDARTKHLKCFDCKLAGLY